MNKEIYKLKEIRSNYIFLLVGGCITSIILITLIFLFSDLDFNIFLAFLMFFEFNCIFLVMIKNMIKSIVN